jgi:hypothetical protein
MIVMRDKVIAGYIKEMLSARVYDVATGRRVHLAPALSRRLNNKVLLKC